MEDPRIISALFIFLKMAYYNVLINTQGMSLSEFKACLQETIDEEMYSDDPEVQENFKRHFGNKRPTPEEYIYTIVKHSKLKF